MSKFARVVLLMLVAFVPLGAWAQQDEDYLQYKFYDEAEDNKEDLLWWLSEDVDSLNFHSDRSEYRGFRSLSYAMRRVNYAPRGEGRAEERHLIGRLDVGYSTARLLTSLGIERGLGESFVMPSVGGQSTIYNIGNS